MAYQMSLFQSDSRDCSLCPLATHKVVWGRGSGKIAVVGEAPGAEEERVGKPFVGDAGKVLEHLMKIGGLRECYITNVVKCRPPENRKPRKGEVEVCFNAWCKQEIKDKEVVILLGDTALKAIFPNRSLSDVEGSVLFKDGKRYIPMYHPAACLHSPELSYPMLVSWKRLPQLLRMEPMELDVEAKIATEEWIERLDGLVAIDTETETLGGRLIGVGLATEHDSAFVPAGPLLAVLAKKLSSLRLIAHNWKYDLSVLVKHGVADWGLEAYDTMVIAHLCHINRLGLKQLALFLFGIDTPGWEELKPKSLEEVAAYCQKDAILTRMVFKRLWPQCPQEYYERIEKPLTPLLARMEHVGVPIDKSALHMFLNEMGQKRSELESHFEFDPDSPRQAAKALGLKSTAKEALAKSSLPEAQKLLEYRQVNKLITTYILPMLKAVEVAEDSRIHPGYHQVRTITGRLSSSNPNFQNIPVGFRFRDIVRAPEGYRLVVADFNQQELRLMAHFSGDPLMMKVYNEGGDIHTQTALRVFGEVNPELRRKAKVVNFAVLYGAGPERVAGLLGISYDEAKAFLDRYFETYYMVREWIGQQRSGVVKTLMGRPIVLADSYVLTPKGIRFTPKEAPNYIIQGSGADQTKLAMVEINRRFRDNGLKAEIVIQVHDELVVLAPKEEAEVVKRIMKEVMENVVKLNVPVKCDVKEVERWSEK